MKRQTWGWLGLTAVALVWAVLQTRYVWGLAQQRPYGSDFASYYWAWQAAAQGLDPYHTANLGMLSRQSGGAGGVHPFFYPPPFLLSLFWVSGKTVAQAYLTWFWVDVLSALACVGVLVRWWGPLDRRLAWLAAIGFLAVSAVANNHGMGQVNLPVLAIALAGLWAEDRDHWAVGGVLLGVACMAKMSPAFLVAWWLLRGKWRPVAVACLTAVGLSVAALSVVDAPTQWRFYTEVLPGFGSGDYNGLRVPIGLWGNHSIPQLLDEAFPSTDGALSPTARLVSSGVLLGTLAVLGAAFRQTPADRWSRYGQIGAVLIALLLVPVYTYEHHLVYAIPAAVVLMGGALAGRLPRVSVVVWALAFAGLAVELGTLREWAQGLHGVAGFAVRELKLAAMLTLFVGCIWLGRSVRR